MKKHFALLGALALPGTAWADCVAPSSIGGIHYVIEAEAATPAELEANPWQFDADGYLIWREGMPEWMRGARRIEDLSEFVEFDPSAPWAPMPVPRKMGLGKGLGDPVLLGCGDEPVDGERVSVTALRVGSFVMLPNRIGVFFATTSGGVGGLTQRYLELDDRVSLSPEPMGCAHPQEERLRVAIAIARRLNYEGGTHFAVAFTATVQQVFQVTSRTPESITVVPYSTCIGG